MAARERRLIDTAEHHLQRAAYRTRDNPYLREIATTSLSAAQHLDWKITGIFEQTIRVERHRPGRSHLRS